LRTVKACSKPHHIKNARIRNRLKIQSVQNKIDEAQNWIDHLDGKSDETVPKRTLKI
jgi:hypothetical protein